MKTAGGIVRELIYHVDPPRGTAIVVNETPSTKPDDPNWIEHPAVMDPMRIGMRDDMHRRGDPLKHYIEPPRSVAL
jgi:hypothetical protein